MFACLYEKLLNKEEKLSLNYYDLEDKFFSCFTSKFSNEDLQKNIMAYLLLKKKNYLQWK